MKAWEILFGWNDGKNPPDEDGMYYVATYYSGLRQLHITTLEYTVDHGWNTSKCISEHGFEIKEPYWWIPMIAIDTEELAVIESPVAEVES